MKEFILTNIDVIIAFVTMVVTYILGKIAKKSEKISNNLIAFQNIAIAVIMSAIYYFATGDFSMVIASASPIATLLYDAIHSLEKMAKE